MGNKPKTFTIQNMDMDSVRYSIKYCQGSDHIQQVAYSTYHDALTQICFTCKRIATNLQEADGE
jgi:hypothetical protein